MAGQVPDYGKVGSGALRLAVLLASDYALLYIDPFGHVDVGTVYAPSSIWYGVTQLFVTVPSRFQPSRAPG